MKPYFVITDKTGEIKHFTVPKDNASGYDVVTRTDTAEKALLLVESHRYSNCFICKVEPVFHIRTETTKRTYIDPLL